MYKRECFASLRMGPASPSPVAEPPQLRRMPVAVRSRVLRMPQEKIAAQEKEIRNVR